MADSRPYKLQTRALAFRLGDNSFGKTKSSNGAKIEKLESV